MTEKDPKDSALDRLFASARKAEAYGREIEYGFEARVAARIRASRSVRMPFPLFAWRFVPVLVTLVVLIAAWIYAFGPRPSVDLNAVTKIGSEEAMLTAFLTGE